MNTRTLAAALAGATLFGLTAVPARAQTAAPGVASPSADAKAAPKPKPKANRAGAVTVTVTVTNSRKVDLVQLQAAEFRLCRLEASARPGEIRQASVG